MRYRITVKTEDTEQTLVGIGDPSEVADALYDAGALGVTVMVMP